MKSLKMLYVTRVPRRCSRAVDGVARNAALHSHKKPVWLTDSIKVRSRKKPLYQIYKNGAVKALMAFRCTVGSIMSDDAVAADWGRQVGWCDRCWCRSVSWERCLVSDRPARPPVGDFIVAHRCCCCCADTDSGIVRVTQRPTTALFRCQRRDLTCSSEPTDVVTTSVRRLQEPVSSLITYRSSTVIGRWTTACAEKSSEVLTLEMLSGWIVMISGDELRSKPSIVRDELQRCDVEQSCWRRRRQNERTRQLQRVRGEFSVLYDKC